MSKLDKDTLNACTDSQLAAYVKAGSSEAFAALTARYLELVRTKSIPFHCGFLDRDDFCQEGLWGLYHAACTFQSERGAKFSTYAGTCIQNHMITAYRKAVSGCRQPLSGFVSLSEGAEVSAPESEDPEARILVQERLSAMRTAIQKMLTPMEQQVLLLYMNGNSYAEIAETMQITPKAADNALQRVRQKLRKQS